jgi:hypothetical protein
MSENAALLAVITSVGKTTRLQAISNSRGFTAFSSGGRATASLGGPPS